VIAAPAAMTEQRCEFFYSPFSGKNSKIKLTKKKEKNIKQKLRARVSCKCIGAFTFLSGKYENID